MNHSYKSCFQPLKIENKGYLSIFITSCDAGNRMIEVLNNLHFSAISTNHYRTYYENKAQLKELLSYLHSELLEFHCFEGCLHKCDIPSLHELCSLNTIYEHTFHEEIIDMIINAPLISFLQPIIDLKNKEVYGYVSLLHIENQTILPSQLFEVAKKTDLHYILDKRARTEAINARINRIPAGIKTFINFSPATITNSEFGLKHTLKLLKNNNIAPNDVVIEVVDTEKVTELLQLSSLLQSYRECGMIVALDDVGPKYATMDVLSKLQPNIIKINSNYIQNCHINPENQRFLEQCILLAKALNIKVIAKGIEEKEEYDYLQSIGIHLAQGYFIEQPSKSPTYLEKPTSISLY
ncbi:EAL domain-containing protein [Metabacillus herbersteinensis]|uniref:EAL domain-containing protein n=1 Tax=Metabacillus herbersteinensis TaxID=283816 RepID=A0ABV6GAH5_9BACI